MLTDTRRSPFAGLYGLPSDAVEWTGGLYQERFQTCADATVPHLQRMFEDKEISHVVENFKIAAGVAEGRFGGTVFGDGDFYKWMEAAMYTAVKTGHKELMEQLDGYVDLISRAQQPDGYLSTKQIIGERNGSASRLGDINDFEVYNFGHLFTSACLYQRLTGKGKFLEVAERAAGYLKKLYADAEKSGKAQTAVCPSHYMGLAELFRTTGSKEYLELLKTAIRLRDTVENGLDDNQDRLPLKDHDRIIGHAVRANYLYAGVADLCLEEGDEALTEVLHKVWKSLVTSKLYITGGCGALYNGASPYGNFFHHQLVHQAYGYEYQLPNMTAYNETCASVGGVYWAWRMFCMEKKAEYADVLERMVLNVNLAAVSMDGTRFFYENMLRRAGKLPYELVWGQERSSYILSYCCPPNLARLIAQMSEYAYAAEDGGIYTVLYGPSRAKVELAGGGSAVLVQETEYPYDGRIRFHWEEVSGEGTLDLHVRIPSWVKKGQLVQELADGSGTRFCRELTRSDAGSYLTLHVENVMETSIFLDLSMEPRLTMAHALVEETCGQVAVERGPLVYCLEGMDTKAETVDDLLIPADVKLKPEEMDIKGRKVTALKGMLLKRTGGYDREALYQEFCQTGFETMEVRFIPYFAWDNRGMDEMRIWMPVALSDTGSREG